MTHRIGNRASCGECGQILVYTANGWDHAGLKKPRHRPSPVAAPIDDSDLVGDSGVVLEYHDAPEDELDTLKLPASVKPLYKHLYAQLTPGQRTMLQALVILLNPETTDGR